MSDEHWLWFTFGVIAANVVDLVFVFTAAFVRGYCRRARELRADDEMSTGPAPEREPHVPELDDKVTVTLPRECALNVYTEIDAALEKWAGEIDGPAGRYAAVYKVQQLATAKREFRRILGEDVE